MSTELASWVLDRLVADEIAEDVIDVVLAALTGDDDLDRLLGGGTATARPEPRREDSAVRAPGGTFLTEITVEGFRGIGPSTTLPLSPRPGLTIVAGRNGSGKSSLSEALEFATTRTTYRWKKGSKLWQEHWRNLHHKPARIRIGLVEEVLGRFTISHRWDDDATELGDPHPELQFRGQKKQTGLAALGWAEALEQLRPILSYDELGGMLTGTPSELHDAISRVLGLGEIAAAIKGIDERLGELKKPARSLAARRRELQEQAKGLPDDLRAVQAAKLLRKQDPDVTALRDLVTGAAAPATDPLVPIRELSRLTLPFTADDARAASAALRTAVSRLADAGSDAARRAARLSVLQQAIRLHRDHGDMPCPVCAGGELDATWADEQHEHVAAEQAALAELTESQQALDRARARAAELLVPMPGLLAEGEPLIAAELTAAKQAWAAWRDAPTAGGSTGALARANHLEQRVDDLHAAVDALRTAAIERLTELDDQWQPLGTRIAAWLGEWDDALRDRPAITKLEAALTWLRSNDKELKEQRLAPIREGAKRAWTKLRQESNVDIGDITLEGRKTSRHLVIPSMVDGVEAGSLAVLSQGELHALALALFLPRATMADSPFRFLVLDDPVQAMDPAKVDGLVELLAEFAEHRQVIVFSHDDRLPAAVRRSGKGATILTVERGADSHVTVTQNTDPATRYLADAFAMITEHQHEKLTEDALRRTLPGMLRFAVEAAAKDRFFGERLGSGASLLDLEQTWNDTQTTRQRVELAIYGEPQPSHVMGDWTRPPYRKAGLGVAGSAMHAGLKVGTDPLGAARDVERLVDDVRQGRQ
ncbi:AAA family ATPase [Propionibacteriaceae bacterium Y2011]